MIAPPLHTRDELELHRQFAIDQFRRTRMEEPLETYLEAFDEYLGFVEELLETTVDLTDLETHALQMLSDKRLLEAFRYLAGPPISADDLKTLVATNGLSRVRFQRDEALVRRIIETVLIKAQTWRRELGERNVVPVAVLSGAYKLESLEYAQANGVALFWSHELQRLLDWIDATRS